MPGRSRKRYTVTAIPSGRFWSLQVEGRRELHTQARHAGEIECMVRDLIALWDEVPEDGFDLDLPTVDDRLLKRKRPRDLNQLAASIVDLSTDEDGETETPPDGKDPAAIALGRKGGLKDGKARRAPQSRASR